MARDVVLQIRVSDAEKAGLEAAAGDRTLTAHIRGLLFPPASDVDFQGKLSAAERRAEIAEAYGIERDEEVAHLKRQLAKRPEAKVAGNEVASVKIVNPGSGYKPGDYDRQKAVAVRPASKEWGKAAQIGSLLKGGKK